MRELLVACVLVGMACSSVPSVEDGGAGGGSGGSSAGGSAGGASAGGSSAGGASGGASAGGSAGGASAGGSSAGGASAGGSSAGGASGGGSSAGGSAGGAGGGLAGGGGSAGPVDGGVPTWRQGVAKWQWVEIPGSALSNVRVADPFNGTMVAPTQRINAWNGLAADRDTNRLYLAGAGGHADWAGNEAYEIDLQANQPTWRLLRGSSPGSSIVFGANYYTDGRPSSTHLYYALHFVRSRGRIFKLSAGSVWGSGNESNSNVDAFNLTVNDWDPMGSWAAGMPHGDAIDRPYAQHPTTDDAYTFFQGSFRKWTAATATWSVLAARPSYANNDVVTASASAVDPTRSRVLFARNAYRVTQQQGLLLTYSGTPTLTDVTFTGAGAAVMSQRGLAMQFVPTEDVFLFKTGSGGAVYRVDAQTFDVTVQPTTGGAPPDSANGVYTRWQYLPLLRGLAYLPSGSSNFWFLATE